MNKTGKYNFYFYGDGTHTGTAPIIATAEMWGNHIGYTYIDRHYGNGGSAANNFNAPMQGTNWFNAGSTASTNQLPGLNCYLAAIESFNPNNLSDRYRWILRKGSCPHEPGLLTRSCKLVKCQTTKFNTVANG